MHKPMLATAAIAAVLGAGGVAVAQIATGVSNPQPRSGSPANVLAAGYKAVPVAAGKDALENPIGIFKTYGFLDDHATQASGLDTKTEPDQNTYLVTDQPGRPDRGLRLRPSLPDPGPRGLRRVATPTSRASISTSGTPTTGSRC